MINERRYSVREINRNVELDSPARRFRRNLIIGILGIIGLTGYWLDYEHDQKGYNEELSLANSIPALERAHNYREAEVRENEGWSYIARARKDGFHVSESQLSRIEKLLNENKTLGTPRGQSLK